jgi:hypothetical protein
LETDRITTLRLRVILISGQFIIANRLSQIPLDAMTKLEAFTVSKLSYRVILIS